MDATAREMFDGWTPARIIKGPGATLASSEL
jgi:hypothetical protein